MKRVIVLLLWIALSSAGSLWVLPRMAAEDSAQGTRSLKKSVTAERAEVVLRDVLPSEKSRQGARNAISLDFLFIVFYMSFLWGLLLLLELIGRPRGVTTSKTAKALPLIAGVTDVAENVSVLRVIDGSTQWAPMISIMAGLTILAIVSALYICVATAVGILRAEPT